jgi:oxalate decarboxylase
VEDPDKQPASNAAVNHSRSEPTGKADFALTDGGGADPTHQHLFHLAGAAPSRFDGGDLRGAVADNWSVLRGQQGSVYLARLSPGGVREPHWHPSAWEMNFVVSGRVRWSLVGPGGTGDAFEGKAGDLVFAPQGHFHYFENASETEDLVILIVFNTSVSEPDDDIGLVESLSAIPPDALAAVFGVPAETFQAISKKRDRVVIASKRKEASNG